MDCERRLPAHLVIECFQECLRYQTRHLIREKDLPEEVLGLVLDLWMMLATKMDFSFTYDLEKEGDDVAFIFDKKGARVKLSDLNKPEHSDLKAAYYNNIAEMKNDNEELESHMYVLLFVTNSNRPVENRVNPQFGLVFIFFACNWLRLPVTLGDVLAWASDGSIPYLSAPSHLPAFLNARLVGYKPTHTSKIYQPEVCPHLLIMFPGGSSIIPASKEYT